MPAIITSDFRKYNAQNFIDEMDASPLSYFVGVGKSDPWEGDEADPSFIAPTPTGSVINRLDVLDNLVSLKGIDDVTRLIPKNTWYSGRKYKIYNPYDPTCFEYSDGVYPCYVYSSADSKVYICLSKLTNSETSGTVPSDAGDPFNPFNVGNYVWAQCYLNNDTLNLFQDSIGFVPVKDDSSSPYASAGTSGTIFGFAVKAGGSGLGATVTSTAGTITCYVEYENGTNAEITINVKVRNNSSGAANLVYVESNQLAASVSVNSEIVRANIKSYLVGSLTGAEFIPLISPINGFNASPLSILPSYYVGIAANFQNTLGGDISDTVTYRQVSLIRNPIIDDSASPDSPSTSDSADTLRYAVMTNLPMSVGNHEGETISFESSLGGADDAVAWIDYVEDTGSDYRLYYHQNSSSSVNRLIPIGDITGWSEGIPSATTVTAHRESEYVHKTGEVIFIEQRKPIIRASSQTDNVRLVIQM